MLEVNNKGSKTSVIWCLYWTYLTLYFSVSVDNFEQVNTDWNWVAKIGIWKLWKLPSGSYQNPVRAIKTRFKYALTNWQLPLTTFWKWSTVRLQKYGRCFIAEITQGSILGSNVFKFLSTIYFFLLLTL